MQYFLTASVIILSAQSNEGGVKFFVLRNIYEL